MSPLLSKPVTASAAGEIIISNHSSRRLLDYESVPFKKTPGPSSRLEMFRREQSSKHVVRKELLGVGSFGSVYRGDWNPSSGPLKEDVAIKVIDYAGDELGTLGRELYFLKRFKSPFIVEYYDSFVLKFQLWIIMELCDAGSMMDLYKHCNITLSEQELRAVIACW